MSLLIPSPLPMTDCTGGFMSDPVSEYYIPDGSIQASTEWDSIRRASYGRLHEDGRAWVPAPTDTQPWIEADIGRVVNVYGIQTQGNGGVRWVTTLKVSTFQNVPGMENVGEFIRDENDVKVPIKQKHICHYIRLYGELAS